MTTPEHPPITITPAKMRSAIKAITMAMVFFIPLTAFMLSVVIPDQPILLVGIMTVVAVTDFTVLKIIRKRMNKMIGMMESHEIPHSGHENTADPHAVPNTQNHEQSDDKNYYESNRVSSPQSEQL